MVFRISPELKRRLRLLVQRFNLSDPSRTAPYDDQLHVGEGAIRGVDSMSGRR
jgi:hypothetical protein